MIVTKRQELEAQHQQLPPSQRGLMHLVVVLQQVLLDVLVQQEQLAQQHEVLMKLLELPELSQLKQKIFWQQLS